MTETVRHNIHDINLTIEIEELEAKIAPDGGETVLCLPPPRNYHGR